MFNFTSYNHIYIYVDYHNEHKMSDHKYEEIDTILCDSNSQDWLGDMESQGAISAVHISNKRRNLSVSHSKSRLQINGNFCTYWLYTYILGLCELCGISLGILIIVSIYYSEIM